jgi:hypothetical protein
MFGIAATGTAPYMATTIGFAITGSAAPAGMFMSAAVGVDPSLTFDSAMLALFQPFSAD